MSMTFESVNTDGSIKSEKIFKEINENTSSYTYRSPTGLLSATQFTQPALTLMEKASFEDMRSKGLVQRDSSFAGHSLGEYSALAALAEVMPIESLVSVVFYRGLTMQVAVERDESGRSNYSMCAVNPSRISKTFNEQALQYVVENISEETNWLLEIVNYNVANMQYVCAGDVGLPVPDCPSNLLIISIAPRSRLPHKCHQLPKGSKGRYSVTHATNVSRGREVTPGHDNPRMRQADRSQAKTSRATARLCYDTAQRDRCPFP